MIFGRFHFVRASSVRWYREIIGLMETEVFMKLVRLVKKLRQEKSLKAYAWYGWV